MRNTYTLGLLLFICFTHTHAQPLSKLWDKRFGGTADDILYSMIATSDGGFLLGGYSNSDAGGDKSQASQGSGDYWVVKIDGSGTKLWDKRFGGGDSDVLYSMIATSDGGFLLGGTSYSEAIGGDKSQTARGNADYWIVKIDALGNKLWDKRYGGSFDENLRIMVNTPDNGFLLGGLSFSNTSGDKSENRRGDVVNDYWIIKINSSGDKVWDKTFGGGDYDELQSVIVTPNGGFLLGGYSSSGADWDKSEASRGFADYWIVRIDANGTKLWDKRFGGASQDRLYNMIDTFDGGFLLGGYSGSGAGGDKSQASQGGSDYWVVKIDGSGTKLWDKRFGGTDGDDLRSMASTSDGGFLLGGGSVSVAGGDKSQASQGSGDYWVVKIDGSGTKLWDKRFGGAGYEYLLNMIATSDGGFLLGGFSASNAEGDKSQASQGSSDYWVVKMSGECSLTASITPNTPQSVCSEAILALSGSSTGGGSPTYAWSAVGGAFESNQQNPTFTAPTVSVSNNYTLTLSVMETCTATATVKVTVAPIPAAPTVKIFKCDNTPSKVWDKRFGGDQHDNLYTMTRTLDGGYLLGGYSASGQSGDVSETNRGSNDFWVVKINADGTKQWDKRIGGSGSDIIRAVFANADGSYTLFGTSASPQDGDKDQLSYGGSDFWGVNLSSLGALGWRRRYGGAGDETLYTAVATADGGWLIGGTTTSGNGGEITQTSRGGKDYLIMKLDAGGAREWDKCFGGSSDDILYSIATTTDGGYLLGGYTNSSANGDISEASQGNNDYWLVKINSAGTEQWDKRLGGSSEDELRSVIQTTDGGYLIAGYSNSGISGDKSQASQGGYDEWIIKTDASGNKQWDKSYGGNGDDEPGQIVVSADGQYVIGGHSASGPSGDKSETGKGGRDYWILKIDTGGGKIWDKSFGGAGHDDSSWLLTTTDNGYLIGGISISGLSGDRSQDSRGLQDYWIVKFTDSCTEVTSPVCANTVVSLVTLGCPGTVTWNNGGTGNRLIYNIASGGSYNYFATCTLNNCTSGNSNTATLTVSVPTVAITATNACIGQSIALSATAGFSSYSWTNSGGTFTSTTNQATFSHDATGGFVFTVTATNSSGCSATATASLTVNALPTASISLSSAAVCAGTPVNLTATAGLSSYSWSSSGGTFTSTTNQATLSSSSSAGGYSFTVTFTNSNGCSATATASATVNELPVVIISPPVAVVCTGQTLNLTATAGLSSYSWISSGGTFTSTTNLTTFSSTTGGGYSFTVTATNANNCSATATASATVNTVAIASLLPTNAVVCAGKPVNLTASAGFSSYSWAYSGGTFTSTTNRATFSSSISGGYSYSVTAMNANGCSATATASVTVRVLPTASIALSNAGVCVGQSINLTATAGLSSYSWSSSGGTFSSTSNQATLSSSSSSGGYSFTVTVTHSNSCSNTATASATVNALPVVSILPANAVLCIGQSVNLTATAGLSSYSWASSGAFTSTTNQATFSSTNPGGYSFSVTVSNGTCTNTASTSLTMNALPAVSISQANSQVCVGTALSLSATTGLGSYSWANSGGAFTSTTNKATFSSSTPATYRFTVTAGNGTCINTATTSVQVMPSFTVSLSVAPICIVGNPLNLSVVGGSNYLWKGPNGFRSTSATPSKPKTVNADEGIYSITVTGNTVCTVTSTIEVYFGVGKITASSNSPVCKGGTIKLSATAAHGGGASYKWTKQLGSTVYTGQNPTIPNAKTSDGGIYVVFVTGQNGCIVKEEVLVTVNPIACGSGRLASGEEAENQGIRLTLYPNPTQGKLVVAVQMDKAASIELDLLDMVGIPKLHWKTVEETSEYRAELDISTFAEGMYLLRAVSSNQKQATVKVVKIN